jgi:hypothetical protein
VGSLCNRGASSSSVSRARFVTAGAIDPKLCTYVPLGRSNSQTKFRSSLILGFRSPGDQNRKHKKCYDSWTNGWIISKFLSWVYLARIHDIVTGFLILPTFEGHRGQSSKRHQYWHVSLLFYLEQSLCEHVSRHFLPNFGPIRLQIWLPGGLLGKPIDM